MTELSETRMKWLKRLMISLALLIATVEKKNIRTKLNALFLKKMVLYFSVRSQHFIPVSQNAALARSKTMFEDHVL